MITMDWTEQDVYDVSFDTPDGQYRLINCQELVRYQDFLLLCSAEESEFKRTVKEHIFPILNNKGGFWRKKIAKSKGSSVLSITRDGGEIQFHSPVNSAGILDSERCVWIVDYMDNDHKRETEIDPSLNDRGYTFYQVEAHHNWVGIDLDAAFGRPDLHLFSKTEDVEDYLDFLDAVSSYDELISKTEAEDAYGLLADVEKQEFRGVLGGEHSPEPWVETFTRDDLFSLDALYQNIDTVINQNTQDNGN